jgi:chitodextrinase
MGVRRFAGVGVWVIAVIALSGAMDAPASSVQAGRRPPPTVDQTPPTQPTGLQATAVTQTSVTLTWNPSTDNVGVMSYSLWAEGLSGVVSATHPQTTATWSGLRPGQTVTFRVRAFDARYNGSPDSNAVTVTTVADTTAPTTPSGLTPSTVTASTVLLTWNSGTDLFSPVRHEILVNGVPTNNALSTVTAGTFPRPPVQGAWVRQLDPSTTYEFSVRAVDPSGNVSGTSNTVSATTQASSDTVAPTSPTLISAFDGGTGSCPEELWIRWTASTDAAPSSGLEYEVRVNGVINEVHGATQTVTYTEVVGPNTVTIVAVDRAGNASAPSNAMTAFVNVGPPGCGL